MKEENPRLMNRHDAAAYCGVGTSTFHAWVRNGFIPQPLFGSKRWDRKAIDLALDRASGIPTTANTENQETPYQKWKREHGEEDLVERWIRTGK